MFFLLLYIISYYMCVSLVLFTVVPVFLAKIKRGSK
jgi:hypothetical protein